MFNNKFNDNTRTLHIESDPIFGEKIKCNMILPVAKVSEKAHVGYDYTLGDFNKNNVLFQICHGSISHMRRLTTLEDKKVLTGSINVADDINNLLKKININTCLNIFDEVDIEVDPTKFRNGFAGNSDKFVIKVLPILGGYCINRTFTKKLDENVIADAITDKYKVYEPSGNSKTYFMLNGYYREVDLSNYENNTDITFMKQVIKFLRHFKICRVDTSGSLKKKTNAMSYLKIGEGYAPISHSILKQLSLGKHPESLVYRDSLSDEEKFLQPINTGTTGKLFVQNEDKDSIITGFSDKYIESIIKLKYGDRYNVYSRV